MIDQDGRPLHLHGSNQYDTSSLSLLSANQDFTDRSGHSQVKCLWCRTNLRYRMICYLQSVALCSRFKIGPLFEYLKVISDIIRIWHSLLLRIPARVKIYV